MTTFDYLGGPYYHDREDIREARAKALTIIAAALAEKGWIAFSPVTMGHQMHRESAGRLVGNHEFWMRFDGAFMEAADRLIIITLPGWRKSKGLAHEIKAFEVANKDVVELAQPRSYLPADLWALLEEGASP